MSLVIATSFRGSNPWAAHVTIGYAENVRALCQEMPGTEVIPEVVTYACEQVRARNRVAAIVLRDFPKMTYVLWWDDDQWPAERKIVGEMMATGKDLICAPYTNKKPPLRWVHQLLSPCPMGDGGLQRVRSVGFGFTMTSRACLEKMSANARRYTDYPNPLKPANIFGQLYDAPTPGCAEEDETLLSEDFSFCKRWRELGGHVSLYLNAGIIFHAGMYPWSAQEMPGGIVPG